MYLTRTSTFYIPLLLMVVKKPLIIFPINNVRITPGPIGFPNSCYNLMLLSRHRVEWYEFTKKMCPAQCREYFTNNRPEICLSMFIGPHYQKLSYALNVLYLIWIFKYWDTCSCISMNSYCYKTAYAVYNKIWYMYLQYMYLQYILNAMQLYNDS